MKNKLDTALRVMAFVSLLACAVFGAAGVCEGNISAMCGYMTAAAWIIIYIIMREEE